MFGGRLRSRGWKRLKPGGIVRKNHQQNILENFEFFVWEPHEGRHFITQKIGSLAVKALSFGKTILGQAGSVSKVCRGRIAKHMANLA